MHRTLDCQDGRSIVVLYGLGGMVKTQLAIKYVKRHRTKYTVILWINSNDEDSLKLTFVGIARQLLKEHPMTPSLDSVDLAGSLDSIVEAVLS